MDLLTENSGSWAILLNRRVMKSVKCIQRGNANPLPSRCSHPKRAENCTKTWVNFLFREYNANTVIRWKFPILWQDFYIFVSFNNRAWETSHPRWQACWARAGSGKLTRTAFDWILFRMRWLWCDHDREQLTYYTLVKYLTLLLSCVKQANEIFHET